MKKTFLTLAIVLGLAAGGFAYEQGVTPYGDFCPKCTVYGSGHEPVGHARAVAAMEAYFGSKGLQVRNIRSHGRFIVSDIYRESERVDRIIFDRKTGRVRSIY